MAFNSPGADTHMCTYILTSRTKARAWFNKLKIQQLTQHTIALSLEWINPLFFCVIVHRTLTTWPFLIRVPYLGKLSVIYDTENKGLSHFSSNENKG